MAICPTCHKDGYTPPEGSHALPDKDLCFQLEQHPNCKPEWQKFLSQLRGYTRDISQKQWKFFCVIHKECLGTWPPDNASAQQEKKEKSVQIPF